MIDLCVVVYNTKDKVDRLVGSLGGRNDDLYRLFIADNGSTDGSVEVIDRLLGQHLLDGVSFNENVGYASACNNMAESFMRSDIFGFINGDVWLDQRDLELIQESFDMNPDQAIMGPKQRNEEGKITHAGIFQRQGKLGHRYWMKPDVDDKLARDRIECPTVSGSAYFIRRSTWKTLYSCRLDRAIFPRATGCFGDFEHYYEETWLSYHARAHGFKVFYDGTISIGHSWAASEKTSSPRLKKAAAEGKVKFRTACRAHGIASI